MSKLLGLGYFAAIVAVLAAVFLINSYSREHTSAKLEGAASEKGRCIRPQPASGDLVSELAAATSEDEKVKKKGQPLFRYTGSSSSAARVLRG